MLGRAKAGPSWRGLIGFALVRFAVFRSVLYRAASKRQTERYDVAARMRPLQ